MEGATEDDVERRGVYNEDTKACASEDTGEVIRVAYDGATEREGKPCFNGENLRSGQ